MWKVPAVVRRMFRLPAMGRMHAGTLRLFGVVQRDAGHPLRGRDRGMPRIGDRGGGPRHGQAASYQAAQTLRRIWSLWNIVITQTHAIRQKVLSSFDN